MADLPVACGDCGAHFDLDPSGDIQGAACSECGGTRFYRDQPSPTNSDMGQRDMVDSDSQKDQGGNPLGEGTIMGDDGEQSMYADTHGRDNFMHSNVQLSHRDMRPPTLDMEPYPRLWSDEHVAGTQKQSWNPLNTLNDAANAVGQGVSDAAGAVAPIAADVAPIAGEAALGAGEVAADAATGGALTPEIVAGDTALLGGEGAAAANAGSAAKAAPSLMNKVMNGVGTVAQNPAVNTLKNMWMINDAGKEVGNVLGGGAGGQAGGSGYAMPTAGPTGMQSFGSAKSRSHR